MNDVPDAPPSQTPAPIQPARHVSARELARRTAHLLREVADDDQTFAIRHFGRVVAFLVPLEGRVPKKRKGDLVYEVEVEKPLIELGEDELGVLRNLVAEGPMPDPTRGVVSPAKMMSLLARMTYQHGLVEQKGPYWRITPYGRRHVDA